MIDPASYTPTADSPDLEESAERLSAIAQLRAPLVAALIIGMAVLATGGGIMFSGTVAESPGLESSVISDEQPTNQMFFENQRGRTLWVYDVWLAETGPERYQGLSGTETLPTDTGLLFVYDQEATNRAIVMREMDYPIDVVFIDGSGTVTAVHSATPEPGVPETDLTHYAGRARWILEVPHGTATRHAIVPGTSARITGPDHASALQSPSCLERDLR